MNVNGEDETYILLLLSDSNLPTGSFVASSGLESYVKHGFFASNSPDSPVDILQDSLTTYARSALAFVSDSHRTIEEFLQCESRSLTDTLANLKALDEFYETMTLNHVAKRASKSQGVALLSLYSKGFSCPPFLARHEKTLESNREIRLTGLIDQLKLMIRRDETPGYLPVCWGALTGALKLTLGASLVSSGRK